MPLEHGHNRRHGRPSLPWRTFLLSLLATLAYIGAGPAPEAWVFSREAINQGELWTLISGHWVHSDSRHAIWNIAALSILGSLFEYRLKHRIFTELLLASLLLSVWIGRYMPELQAYCGLSGILNTLLVTGAIALWQRYRSMSLLLIPGLALVKNLIELFSQQAIFTHTAWPSVPQAHLVGMGIGLLLVLLRSGFSSQARSVLTAARPE